MSPPRPVSFDPNFPEHPKVLPLTDAAFRLHVRAIFYSNRYLTDGYLSFEQAARLASTHDSDDRMFVLTEERRTVCDELVRHGLWDSAEDGFRIHDYTDHQPSRAEVETQRSRWRDEARGRRRRRRRSPGESPVLPPHPPQRSSSVSGSSVPVSVQSGLALEPEEIPEILKPEKGSLAWFVAELPDATERTPAAIATVVRKWSLPEAALYAALEEVELGGASIRNKAGLFVSKLNDYGRTGRYAA